MFLIFQVLLQISRFIT